MTYTYSVLNQNSLSVVGKHIFGFYIKYVTLVMLVAKLVVGVFVKLVVFVVTSVV